MCRYGHKFARSIGGTSTIIIGVAVAAHCAMSLPISTPPNAIAYSTGLIQQTDMVKAGAHHRCHQYDYRIRCAHHFLQDGLYNKINKKKKNFFFKNNKLLIIN